MVWRVVSGVAGEVLEEYKEQELRLSVSCKFHLFASEQEEQEFKEGSKGLTAVEVVRGLVEELRRRGRLPEGWTGDLPLHKVLLLLLLLIFIFCSYLFSCSAPTYFHVLLLLVPLLQLAPLLVREFTLPLSPGSQQIDQMWQSNHGVRSR